MSRLLVCGQRELLLWLLLTLSLQASLLVFCRKASNKRVSLKGLRLLCNFSFNTLSSGNVGFYFVFFVSKKNSFVNNGRH